jgi:hypothetical protein
MRDQAAATPFDSIEGAHEYVALLCAEIVETRRALDEDVAQATRDGATRRLEALQLVTYKLERLQHHMESGRRLLNDLRSLRRLLLSERLLAPEPRPRPAPAVRSPGPPESGPQPRPRIG